MLTHVALFYLGYSMSIIKTVTSIAEVLKLTSVLGNRYRQFCCSCYSKACDLLLTNKKLLLTRNKIKMTSNRI